MIVTRVIRVRGSSAARKAAVTCRALVKSIVFALPERFALARRIRDDPILLARAGDNLTAAALRWQLQKWLLPTTLSISDREMAAKTTREIVRRYPNSPALVETASILVRAARSSPPEYAEELSALASSALMAVRPELISADLAEKSLRLRLDLLELGLLVGENRAIQCEWAGLELRKMWTVREEEDPRLLEEAAELFVDAFSSLPADEESISSSVESGFISCVDAIGGRATSPNWLRTIEAARDARPSRPAIVHAVSHAAEHLVIQLVTRPAGAEYDQAMRSALNLLDASSELQHIGSWRVINDLLIVTRDDPTDDLMRLALSEAVRLIDKQDLPDFKTSIYLLAGIARLAIASPEEGRLTVDRYCGRIFSALPLTPTMTSEEIDQVLQLGSLCRSAYLECNSTPLIEGTIEVLEHVLEIADRNMLGPTQLILANCLENRFSQREQRDLSDLARSITLLRAVLSSDSTDELLRSSASGSLGTAESTRQSLSQLERSLVDERLNADARPLPATADPRSELEERARKCRDMRMLEKILLEWHERISGPDGVALEACGLASQLVRLAKGTNRPRVARLAELRRLFDDLLDITATRARRHLPHVLQSYSTFEQVLEPKQLPLAPAMAALSRYDSIGIRSIEDLQALQLHLRRIVYGICRQLSGQGPLDLAAELLTLHQDLTLAFFEYLGSRTLSFEEVLTALRELRPRIAAAFAEGEVECAHFHSSLGGATARLFLFASDIGGGAILLRSDGWQTVGYEHLTEDLVQAVDAELSESYDQWRRKPESRGALDAFSGVLNKFAGYSYQAVWRPLIEIPELLGAEAEVVLIPCGPISILPWHIGVPNLEDNSADVTERLAISYLADVRGTFDDVSPKSEPFQLSVLASAGQPMDAPPEIQLFVECLDVVTTPLVEWDEQPTSRFGPSTLHFAGHSYNDVANPWNSGMATAFGTLTARDILAVKLGYDAVIACSCESGMYAPRYKGSQLSLQAAFCLAGASGSIASSWLLPDLPATLFSLYLISEAKSIGEPDISCHWAAVKTLRQRSASEHVEQLRDWLKKARSPAIKAFLTDAILELALAPPDSRPFGDPVYWASFTYMKGPSNHG